MIVYGYIIDLGQWNPEAGDIEWPFDRTNQDQTTTSYNGIETPRDLSGDNNVVIIGDNRSFKVWLNEFL